MAEENPVPANPEGDGSDGSASAPAPEGQPTQPQSLADTQPDVKQVLGSRSPQAEERLRLIERRQKSADGE
jgi:hypothetical protein